MARQPWTPGFSFLRDVYLGRRCDDMSFYHSKGRAQLMLRRANVKCDSNKQYTQTQGRYVNGYVVVVVADPLRLKLRIQAGQIVLSETNLTSAVSANGYIMLLFRI